MCDLTVKSVNYKISKSVLLNGMTSGSQHARPQGWLSKTEAERVK